MHNSDLFKLATSVKLKGFSKTTKNLNVAFDYLNRYYLVSKSPPNLGYPWPQKIHPI